MPRKAKQPEHGSNGNGKYVPAAPPPDLNSEAWDGKPDRLTPRQRIFIDKLFNEAGGVAKRAHELAGYQACDDDSRRAGAAQLLANINVQRAIERRAYANWGSKEDLVKLVAQLLLINPDAFIDEKGCLDLGKARAHGAMMAIEGYDPSTGKVKFANKARLAELLAKMLGMLKQEAQVITATTDGDGKPILKVYSGVTLDDL